MGLVLKFSLQSWIFLSPFSAISIYLIYSQNIQLIFPVWLDATCSVSPAQGDFWNITESEELCSLGDLPPASSPSASPPVRASGASWEFEEFPRRCLSLLLTPTPSFPAPFPPNSSCVRASVLWSLSPSHSETAGLCFPASWGRGRGQRRTCGLTPAASYGLACLQFLRRFCPGVIVAEPMLADRSHKQKTGAALCYSFNSYLHFLYLKLSTPVASEVLKPEGIDYVASSPDSSHLRSPPPVVTAAFLRSCMQSSRDGYFFTVDPRENTACLSWRFVFFQTWKTISLETCKNKI